MLPLTGTTVVSLEHAVAAPFATRQLADLGARIIKIERPDTGDFARQYDESVNGSSSYFVWLNRSKESVALDVKTKEGRHLLHQLVDLADVVVQNLGPGAADRLGLAAADIHSRDPRKIVLNMTGWGSDGPWSERKAYDLLVQCETGLLSLTGTPDEGVKVGVSIADIAAGMYGFSGVLAALLRKATTGEGASLEISLFDALAEWLGQPAHFTAGAGHQPARFGAQHATIAPYGPFPTNDGKTVMLAVQNEPEWKRLCDTVLDDTGIAADERFATNTLRVSNRDALNSIVSKATSKLPADLVIQRLSDARIAYAGINTVDDFLKHPVLMARSRWCDVDTPSGPVRALLPPLRFDTPARMDAVPALGEHTLAVLSELGLAPEEIRHYARTGVVAAPDISGFNGGVEWRDPRSRCE